MKQAIAQNSPATTTTTTIRNFLHDNNYNYYMPFWSFLCNRRKPAVSLVTVRARIIALLRWRTKVSRISVLLARRRAWAVEGQALAEPRLQRLLSGLEKRKGWLTRVAPGVQ